VDESSRAPHRHGSLEQAAATTWQSFVVWQGVNRLDEPVPSNETRIGGPRSLLYRLCLTNQTIS